MNLLKRIVSYSPYLLILLVVFPVFSSAKTGDTSMFDIKNILWTFVNNVFGFLIGAAGVLLDFAVNKFVIGFGETWGVNSTGVGGAIDMSWKIVRDVFNITFIFGLVWLGFKMILRSDDSNTRRTLITLIIAALLVNFSLFITKFVVDFTNILASEIAGAFSDDNNPANPAEVSKAFMQLFGLSSIWHAADSTTKIAGDTSYMYIFGTAIVFMIGAFCFAAGGIMLIIRFAALCIYMVFSPLMFLGMVFPGLKKVSSDYWSGFLGRAFFAPAYLMLIYLAAFVMGSYNNVAPQFASALNGEKPDLVATTIGPFMLTCVFLIASVVVAGKMSADGATTAISMGKNLTGRAQRGLKNTAVWTGRTATAPVRRVGRSLDNTTGNKINSYLDRKQKEDGRILGFKARNYRVDSVIRGEAQRFKDSKNGESLTADEAAKKQAAIHSRADADKDIDAGKEELKKPKEERNPEVLAKMQSAIGDLGQKRLESMTDKELTAIVPYLKSGQFDKFMESDDVGSDRKDLVFGARKKALNDVIEKAKAESGTALREAIGKLSIKQIETMGDTFIRDNADLFTKDQMDSIKKSDKFIEEQKGAYIGARKIKMFERAGKDNAHEYLLENQKPVEIAQYPATVLQSANVYKALKPDVLKQIIKKDSLTASEMNVLRGLIEQEGLSETQAYLKSPQGRKDWYDGKEFNAGRSNNLGDPVV